MLVQKASPGHAPSAAEVMVVTTASGKSLDVPLRNPNDSLLNRSTLAMLSSLYGEGVAQIADSYEALTRMALMGGCGASSSYRSACRGVQVRPSSSVWTVACATDMLDTLHHNAYYMESSNIVSSDADDPADTISNKSSRTNGEDPLLLDATLLLQTMGWVPRPLPPSPPPKLLTMDDRRMRSIEQTLGIVDAADEATDPTAAAVKESETLAVTADIVADAALLVLAEASTRLSLQRMAVQAWHHLMTHTIRRVLLQEAQTLDMSRDCIGTNNLLAVLVALPACRYLENIHFSGCRAFDTPMAAVAFAGPLRHMMSVVAPTTLVRPPPPAPLFSAGETCSNSSSNKDGSESGISSPMPLAAGYRVRRLTFDECPVGGIAMDVLWRMLHNNSYPASPLPTSTTSPSAATTKTHRHPLPLLSTVSFLGVQCLASTAQKIFAWARGNQERLARTESVQKQLNDVESIAEPRERSVIVDDYFHALHLLLTDVILSKGGQRK